MSHRYSSFQTRFLSALCALCLVLACGLKEPLHFLSHDAADTACALSEAPSATHQAPVSLEVAHDTCLLKAFFEAVAQTSFEISSNVVSIPAALEPITAFQLFPSEPYTSASETHWQSSRGPPQV